MNLGKTSQIDVLKSTAGYGSVDVYLEVYESLMSPRSRRAQSDGVGLVTAMFLFCTPESNNGRICAFPSAMKPAKLP